ncbi:hypothetical protein BRADI_5g10177v3 [Brachypodium distachyon]|uniref:Phosphatidylinositol-specific phospholipase C X domain-containing protein n=1 Tax=Brachypodium distachyon TaxID=15368 RepID=A0A0Q3GP66_BRADI|nr:hypothetical protein BRADI_5g10177v3 [Brachypodium distachyon]
MGKEQRQESPPMLLVVALAAVFLCSCPAAVSARKVGETCALGRNCDAGLHCETCVADGNVRPRCTRVTPVDPQTKDRGLPFNRYSWLTTHNSFARLGTRSQTGTAIATAWNQQDTVTQQLNNGVRGLMLDMYDFRNDIWLCHSYGGACQNFTAFTPAVDVLREIEAFLAANPSEVVTIFIEDYVESPRGLTRVFNASGLTRYLFPAWRMPKNGGDWPLLGDMVRDNHRLLVFTSRSAKEASEGFAHEWRYVVENQCMLWEQRDGEGVVPEPGRVGRHERPVQVAGAGQLLPGPPKLPGGVQGQLGAAAGHARRLPRRRREPMGELRRRRFLQKKRWRRRGGGHRQGQRRAGLWMREHRCLQCEWYVHAVQAPGHAQRHLQQDLGRGVVAAAGDVAASRSHCFTLVLVKDRRLFSRVQIHRLARTHSTSI